MKINLAEIYVFNMPELHYFEHTSDLRYFAIRHIIVNQENILEKVKSDFETKLKTDKSIKMLDDRDRSSYYDKMYSLEEESINELTELHRYSVIQIIFASFEGQLRDLCDILERHLKLTSSLEEINANGDINRYWKFITKIVRIKNYSLERIFHNINAQKYVRHKITHRNGNINKSDLPKIRKVKGLTILNWGEVYKIKISSIEYLISLNENIKEFFKIILKEVDEIYNTQMKNSKS